MRATRKGDGLVARSVVAQAEIREGIRDQVSATAGTSSSISLEQPFMAFASGL